MAKEKLTVAYKDWQLADIKQWCIANNKVDWLKATAKKMIKTPIYPKIENISKTGKRTHKYDKTQKPIGYEEKPISFVQLKKEFIATFFELPEKPAKLNMWDDIAAM